ncbi:MAG: hypothetical protein HWN80_19615 [Candidatus Lokiarchaeota archaeon]|nr:hypothetical protein [Candidatus Lokiarchaeota archaeon]
MKAISLLITSVFLFSLGTGVLAQETELPDPGLTPDSPFYFLEIIAEEIGNFFTFGDLKKAERHAILAAERLAEAQVIAGKGKPELTEKTLARYENQLEKSMARVERAESKGENTEKVMEVLARVGQATSIHLEVLAEVYEKVPEQAKPAIENAMKVSVKGHEKAVEALKAQNALGEIPEEATLPAQVPQEVRERVQMRVQQELEAEKAEGAKENDLQSFESFRAFCIEQGAPPEMCASLVNDLQSSGSLRAFFCTENGALPPEMCEKIPLQGFESFEQIGDFCIGVGGTPELCSSVEGRCREVGVTTPDECFLVLLTATVTTSPAPSLSEEEMEGSGTIEPQTEEGAIETPMEELECEFNEIIFYYREGCSWCQKVKDDGTIERIEELGVKVNQVDATIGPIQHQFSGVPTFVIDEKVHIGYRAFEELKELLGCQ